MGSDVTQDAAERAQQDACVEACHGAGLIVVNLFSLEGFHVAEKLQVRGRARSCREGVAAGTASWGPSSFNSVTMSTIQVLDLPEEQTCELDAILSLEALPENHAIAAAGGHADGTCGSTLTPPPLFSV